MSSPARGMRLPPSFALLALSAMAAAMAAAPALAIPADPRSPSDDAYSATQRPEFSWSRGSAATGDRYEVHVEGLGVVATATAPTRTATADIALPDDQRLRWFVRTIHADPGFLTPAVEDTTASRRREIRISTPAPAPVIASGPAGPTAAPAPAFSWTGSRVSSAWALTDARGRTLASGRVAAGGGTATMAALRDGSYVFRVAQRNLQGASGPAATRPFSVDTVAPGPVAVTAAPVSPTTTPAPTFGWSGVEPGGSATWRVLGAGGATVQGPADTTAATTAVGPLAAGAYAFEVRGNDAAGNPGPWASAPFTIRDTPKAPVRAGARLPRRNAGRLGPRAGARIGTARPTLRWERGPRGTTFYNVQLFRVTPRGGRLVKVHTAFPAARHYRMPRRARLATGACYVWRVWPYRAGGFTPAPLGVSNFCVKRHL